MDKHITEQIAAIEHDQWCQWSQHLAATETLSADRLERWKVMWVPYDQLPEHVKDGDRVWAKKVLEIINSRRIRNISRPKYIAKTIDLDLI